ncbi:TPA: class I SAM-dependent methyltransferase, partial [Streptococcus pyogenes]|nr:class I SAM-dependent methyltransferase [Streptococcus pyogenes]
IFGHPSNAKSIIVLQKQTDHPMETFVYPIRDLKLAENIHDFMENFKKWKLSNVN